MNVVRMVSGAMPVGMRATIAERWSRRNGQTAVPGTAVVIPFPRRPRTDDDIYELAGEDEAGW